MPEESPPGIRLIEKQWNKLIFHIHLILYYFWGQGLLSENLQKLLEVVAFSKGSLIHTLQKLTIYLQF